MPSNFDLQLGDSIELMAKLADESVDCVITDPPYVGFNFENTTEGYWKTFEPFYAEIKRVCKGPAQRIAVSQPPARIKYFASKLETTNAINMLDAFNDKRKEAAVFLLRNPLQLEDVKQESWPDDVVPESIHPNDRNINKMAAVVKAMSKPGDLVLDPFCGSAAIGVACLLLGRRFLGMELMPDRAKDAEQRLAAVAT